MGNALSRSVQVAVVLDAQTAGLNYMRAGTRIGGMVYVRGSPEAVREAKVKASLDTTTSHSYPETVHTGKRSYTVVRTTTGTLVSVPLTLSPPFDARKARSPAGESVVAYEFSGVVPKSTKTSFSWKDGSYGAHLKTEIFAAAEPQKLYDSVFGTDSSKALPPIWPSRETRKRRLMSARPVKGGKENWFLLSDDLDDIAVSIDADVVSRGRVVTGIVRIAHKNAAGELREEPSDVKRIDIAVYKSHSVHNNSEAVDTLAFKSIDLNDLHQAKRGGVGSGEVERLERVEKAVEKAEETARVAEAAARKAEKDDGFYSPRAKRRRQVSRGEQRRLAEERKRVAWEHELARRNAKLEAKASAQAPTSPTPTSPTSPTSTKAASPNNKIKDDDAAPKSSMVEIPFEVEIPVAREHFAGSDYSIPPFSSNTSVDVKVVYNSMVKMSTRVCVPIRLVSPKTL